MSERDQEGWEIYILELQNGHIYVGRSQDADSRIRKHFQGKGAYWTKLHKPIKVLKRFKCSSRFEEDMWTKKMMKEYGINKVRGGSYTMISLPDTMKKMIQLQIRGSQDECYRCGKKGHFISQCFMKKSQGDFPFMEEKRQAKIDQSKIQSNKVSQQPQKKSQSVEKHKIIKKAPHFVQKKRWKEQDFNCIMIEESENEDVWQEVSSIDSSSYAVVESSQSQPQVPFSSEDGSSAPMQSDSSESFFSASQDDSESQSFR